MPNVVLERMAEERDRINDQIDELLGAIEADGRDPSEAERQLVARQRARLEELEPQIVEMLDLEEQRGRARDARAVISRERRPAPPPTAGAEDGSPAGGDGSPVLYRSPGAFIVDYLRARGGMRDHYGAVSGPDATAVERMGPWLARALENQTTTDTPGLLPEPILGDVLAQKATVQPFISSIGGAKPMGGIPGKQFQRPKITQHTVAGLQTGEKTQLPSRKMVISGMPFTKVTKGGTVDISRQDIDWTVPSAWDILLRDLAAVYGEEVEDEAAADVVAKATINTPVQVVDNSLEAWAAALYEAAAQVFTNTTPRRLPDRIWVSLDVWADMGPLIDVAIVNAGNQIAELLSSQGASGFGGNVLALPRYVVPGFPGGTAMIGVSTAYEVYEEVVGVLSAVEPALFGVQVAYGGYVAMNAVEPEGLCKVLPPTAGP